MGIDKQTFAAAKSYTDKAIEGGGAQAGKDCEIESIVPITEDEKVIGNRVTFSWYHDGTQQTESMDVMNGQDGADGQDGAQGAPGQDGKDGKDGADGQDGAPGAKGDPGLGIKSVAIDSNNHLIVTYDDDTTQDAGEVGGGGTDYSSEIESLSTDTSELASQITSLSTSQSEIDSTQTSALNSLSQAIESQTDYSSEIASLSTENSTQTSEINSLSTAQSELGSEVATKQNSLTAGAGITITNNVISVNGKPLYLIVQTLPTQDIQTDIIYWLPSSDPSTSDNFEEYIYDSDNARWERIGSAAVDLSNYYTTSEVDSLLESTITSLSTSISTSMSELASTAASLSTENSTQTASINSLTSENSTQTSEIASLSTAESELTSEIDVLGSEVADKQDALTAGDNITIEKVGDDTVISGSGGGSVYWHEIYS